MTWPGMTVDQLRPIIARQIRQLNATGIAGWTPDSVRAAQSAQSQGDWSALTRLGRKITTDPFIGAALKKRVNALVQSAFRCVPASDSEVDTLVSAGLEGIWEQHVVSESLLARIVKDVVLYDLFVGFATWRSCEGVEVPCIVPINTEHVRYQQYDCRWMVNLQSGPTEIHPGDGNWILISSWTPGDVSGAAATLGLAWLYSQMSLVTWVDGNRNSASPSMVIVETEEIPHSEEAADIDTLLQELVSYLADGVGYLRNGLDVKPLAPNTAWKPESFEKIIDNCQKSVSIYLNGGNLSNSVEGGSYAAAEVHNGVAKELTQGDAKQISTGLHNQLTVPYARFNFGPEVGGPWPTWSTESEVDVSQRLDGLTTLKALMGDDWPGIEDADDIAAELGASLNPAVAAQPQEESPKPDEQGQEEEAP